LPRKTPSIRGYRLLRLRSARQGQDLCEKLDKTFANDARDAKDQAERIAQQQSAEQLDKAISQL
jgi:hypothetical protein